MSPVYAVQLALIVVVAAVAGSRLRIAYQSPGDLVARALFLGPFYLDIALVLGYPGIYWFVYRRLGSVPGLPQLVQHGATLAMAYYMQVFMFQVASRDTSPEPLRAGLRRRRRWLLIGLAALFVGYLIGPLRSGLPMVSATGERDPGVTTYVAVVQFYVCYVVADMLRLCWVNRDIRHPFLRTGLKLTGLGCAFALLFGLHKMVYFVAAAADIRLPWAENGRSGVQLILLGPALILGLAGTLIPMQGPRVARWWGRRSAYRTLGPLASALSTAVPATIMIAPGLLQGQYARLLSRVIGIRDVLTGPLRPHLDARVYEAARQRASDAGAAAEEADVIAEAACMAVAVESCRSAEDAAEAALQPPHDPPPLALHEDLDSEAAWLARVSDAYAHSAVVGSVLADLDPSRVGREPAMRMARRAAVRRSYL